MKRWMGVLVALVVAFAFVATVERDRFGTDESRIAALEQQSNSVEAHIPVLEDSTTATRNSAPITQESSDNGITGITVVAPATATTRPDGSGTTTPTNPPADDGTTTTTVVAPTTPTTPPGGGGTTTTTTPPAGSGTHLLIVADTVFNEPIVLRAGDTIEFRNGARLSCGAGCFADWQGTPTSTWSGNGSTQNLQRDIKIFGQGDIRFEAGSRASIIRYVEIDLQPKRELAHYPLHWHFAGDGSRGTLVEGVVVKNSTNRGFVPHASHGITFRDTIASNIAGEAYWWDPPGSNESCGVRKTCTGDNSNDITYDHVLADGITNGVGDNRGFFLSGFFLGAGSGNVVRNSVARNINPTHVKSCAGFHWPGSANQNHGGNVWVFSNNKTFDDRCHGIFVWQNDGNHHIISGFTGPGIYQGAYGNNFDYRNVDVGYVIVRAVGWTMTDSTAGDVLTRKHNSEGTGTVTFTNVAMTSFTVDNGGGTTSVSPATYVLNNVGLTCGDIIYLSVVPDTQVIIDGTTC